MDIGKLRNIDKSEVEELKRFIQEANELRQRRIFKGEIISIKFTLKIPEFAATNVKFPDEEDLRSALMHLRLFYMKNEPLYFYHISNILYPSLIDDELKDCMKSIKERYKGNLECNIGLGPRDGPKRITRRYLIDLFFYGRYFHVHEDNRRELVSLESRYSPEMLKRSLLIAISNIVGIVTDLKTIAEEALGENWKGK